MDDKSRERLDWLIIQYGQLFAKQDSKRMEMARDEIATFVDARIAALEAQVEHMREAGEVLRCANSTEIRSWRNRAESAEAALAEQKEWTRKEQERADRLGVRVTSAEAALAAAREAYEKYGSAFIRACAEIAELINRGNDDKREDLNLKRLTSADVIPRFLDAAALRSRADDAGRDDPTMHMMPGDGRDGNDTVFMWSVSARDDDAGRVERAADALTAYLTGSGFRWDDAMKLARAVLAAADGGQQICTACKGGDHADECMDRDEVFCGRDR